VGFCIEMDYGRFYTSCVKFLLKFTFTCMMVALEGDIVSDKFNASRN
jgi:hypothetical protein